MPAALHGNLQDFGIGEVFQLIGQQRKTGILEVQGDQEQVHVAFSDGAVFYARAVGPHPDAALADLLIRIGLLTPEKLIQVEGLRDRSPDPFKKLLIRQADLSADQLAKVEQLVTKETLFRLLQWRQGSFHFLARQNLEDASGPGIPAEQILMDGLRMIDEWRALDECVREPSCVLQHAGRFAEFRGSVRGYTTQQLAAAERVFDLVDGRATVRRVVDLSRLGTFEATRWLSEMRRAGALEEAARGPVQRARASRMAAGREPGNLLLLLPYAALLAVVIGIAIQGVVPRAPEPGSIDWKPIERARAAFALRRMRHRVEAQRYATGRTPESAGELRTTGLGMDALTSPAPDSYHLETRGNGVAVLAPDS